MKWPTQSPDINMTENLQKNLVKKVPAKNHTTVSEL